ncbi:hypothetical protein CRG98_044448 [Punica granatum]|uniref:GTPase HflX N-terminal domain-containing protein n=1 Tax=Punica granatum TaxID=22663 RepID=A0A2I0HU87_PUNGR|nr:hypothetical protein CRG98_044448 [Punica granatum]
MSLCSSLIGRFSPLVSSQISAHQLPQSAPAGAAAQLSCRRQQTQEEEGADAHEAPSEVPTTQLEEYPASPPREEVDHDSLEDRCLRKELILLGWSESDTEDSFGVEESLKELGQLPDTAGLRVVGSTYQKLSSPNPWTYIGSGKVAEIKTAIHDLDVETVIFDDEL